MLSPAAGEFLELMAQRAQAITKRHFGRTISLYTPLYLSNFCNGGCLYCGIAADRRAKRAVLDEAQLRHEMQAIKNMHLEELVLLTGERMPEADVPYLRDCVSIAAEYIHNVTVEVFPMAEEEYRELADSGCTGVTLYQETYDEVAYEKMHRWGDKRNFANRLDAPDRALRGGMRTIGIGALLGLADPAAILREKVLPFPGSLLTSISPSRSSAMLRVIARPRPVPPKRRVVEGSAWEKGWKIRET